MDSKYFSVSVIKGPKVMARAIRNFDLSKTVYAVLQSMGYEDEESVRSVSVPKSDDPASAECEVELSCPLSVLVHQFRHDTIRFYLPIEPRRENSRDDTTKKNAFDILMAPPNALPAPRPAQRFARDKLFNDILSMFETQKLSFKPSIVETVGVNILDTLADALYYLDPHHDKLENRSCPIPETFKQIHGYNDWKAKKVKEPRVSTNSRFDLNQGAVSLKFKKQVSFLFLPPHSSGNCWLVLLRLGYQSLTWNRSVHATEKLCSEHGQWRIRVL